VDTDNGVLHSSGRVFRYIMVDSSIESMQAARSNHLVEYLRGRQDVGWAIAKSASC
jgi:hypothetical protein